MDPDLRRLSIEALGMHGQANRVGPNRHGDERYKWTHKGAHVFRKRGHVW